MPDEADLVLAGLSDVPPPPDTNNDEVDAVLGGLPQPPPTIPHTPIDNSLERTVVDTAFQQAKARDDVLAKTSLGLSQWDDYNEQMQASGAIQKGTLVNTTLEEETNSVFRFLVKEGYTADASILSGDRYKKLHASVRDQFIRFGEASGYADVWNAQESKEIFRGMLFREMVKNTRPSVKRWGDAAVVSLDTLIDGQLKELSATATPSLGDSAYPARFEALANLQAMSPDDKLALVKYAHRSSTTYESTSDVDQLMYKQGRTGQGAVEPSLKRYEQEKSMSRLRLAFGTDKPELLLSNANRKTQEAFVMKDMGFLEGDITRHGVMVVDPEAPGRMTPLSFVPFKTVEDIEERLAKRRLSGAGVAIGKGKVSGLAPPTSAIDSDVGVPMIQSYIAEFGEELGREKLASKMAQDRMSRLGSLSQMLSLSDEVATRRPEEEAALGVSGRAFLWLAHKMESAYVAGAQIAKGMDDAVSSTGAGENLLKSMALRATGNVDLAAQSTSFRKAWSTVLHSTIEHSNILEMFSRVGESAQGVVNELYAQAAHDPATLALVREETVARQKRARESVVRVMEGSGNPSGAEMSALNTLDPATRADMYAAINSGHMLMRNVGASADAEQQERMSRMSDYVGGRGGTAGQHFKDTVGSAYYEIGMQVRSVVGDFIDKPENFVSGMMLNYGLGKGAQAMQRLRGGITNFMLRGAKIREASKIVGQYLPSKYGEIKASLNSALDSGTGGMRHIERAAVELEALAKEARLAERMGSFAPDGGGVSRFANSMARAFPYLGENTPKAIVDIVNGLPNASKLSIGSDLYRTIKSATKAPIDSLVAGTQTARAAQENVVRYARKLLDVNPSSSELSVLRAQRSRAISDGNHEAVTDLTNRISQLGAGKDGAVSPLDAIKIITERDKLTHSIKIHADRVTALEHEAAADPTSFKDHELLAGVRKDMATASRQHSLLGDKLRNGPMLEEMDVAQLVVARDTGKLGQGFFSSVNESFHNGIARIFGTKDFDTVKKAATAADRLTSFAFNEADNWLNLKARQGRGKMRNDLLYRRVSVDLDHKIEAVDLDIRYIQNEQAFPERLSPDQKDFLAGQMDDLNTRRVALLTDKRQLHVEWDAMNALPAGEGWALKDKHVARLGSQDTIVDVINKNGEYFDFEDAGPTEVLNGDQLAQLAERKTQLDRARTVDLKEEARKAREELATLRPEYVKSLKAQKARQAAEAAAPPPNIPFADRMKPKKPDTALSPEAEIKIRYELLNAKLKAIAGEKRRLHGQSRAIAETIEQNDLAIQKLADAPNRFNMESASDLLRRETSLLESDAGAAAAQRALGADINPMMAGHIPLHLKGLASYKNLLTTKHQTQADAVRLSALNDFLQHAPPKQRRFLGAAIREGRLPSELYRDNPGFAHRVGLPTRGAEPMLRNLDNYIRYEAQAQAELLEEGLRTGIIDAATHARIRRKDYDPGVYGLKEGPGLVQTATIDKLRRSLGKSDAPSTDPGVDADALQFKRDPVQWRVFVQEKDGFVYDTLVDTPAMAQRIVRERYGVELNIRESDVVGKTSTGGNITIARPIGEEGLAALGFEKNATPERRLVQFTNLHRDIAMHQYLESNRGIPGMVLTREEFVTAAAKAKGSSEFETQYMQLPNQPNRYGSMSGAFVHRKVLSEINMMQHSFTQLKSWVEGVMETYSDFSRFGPQLFGRIPIGAGKIVGGINRLVKTSQILLSWKTWVGNMTSNVFADHFVGGRAWASDNMDNMRRAIDEVTTALRSPRDFLGAVDPTDFTEATRLGVLNGSVFDKGNEAFRKTLIRAIGWDDAPKIRAHKQRLVALRNEEAHLIRSQNVKDTTRWKELELAIAAEDAALTDFDKGRMKNFAKKMSGFFMMGTDARGLPTSALGTRLRERYGQIDDIFRYASFLNLKRQGFTGEEAARRILDFAQNYGNVPTAVGQLGQSLAGSLVPMFPYEQARLMKNYATKMPMRLVGALALIPAINAISAGLAGIPISRINAMHRASGDATSVDVLVGQATQLYMWNPTTKETEDIIPLGRTFTPGFQLMSDYGVVNEAMKKWIPDEDNSVLANMVRVAGKAGSSFFLNNPVVNNAYALFQGVDPITGQPYNNDKGTSLSSMGRAVAGMGRTLVPPWAPVIGRVANDMLGLDVTPIHPETGKPYGQQQLGTMLLRELTAIPARGRAAKSVTRVIKDTARLLGQDVGTMDERGVAVPDESIMISMMYEAEKSTKGESYSSRLSMYGADAEKRRFWAALMNDASSPAEKERAQKGIEALAAEERTLIVNSQKYAFTPTAREQANYMRAVQKRGSIEHFGRLDVRGQTMVLVEANKAQVNPRTLNNFVESARMTDNWETAMVRDPGQINQALALVEGWVRDPRAAPALKDWHDWLISIQAKSTKMYDAEVLRASRKDQLRREGVIR